jgi:hypothetical protein
LHLSLIHKEGIRWTFFCGLAVLFHTVKLHILKLIVSEDDNLLVPLIDSFPLPSDWQKQFQSLSRCCVGVLGIDDWYGVKITLQCRALSSDTIPQSTIGHFLGSQWNGKIFRGHFWLPHNLTNI